MGGGPTVRVATVNLLNDLSRWPERRSILVEELAGLSLDLIGLQEVTDPLGASTAHWIAGELGGYSVHVSPKSGWARRREGIAVLSRLPVEGHEVIDLGSQQRTAQVVRARVGGRPVALVNGHYYWPVGAHGAQARQVGLVLDRIEGLGPGPAVVVCGDFNATPDSRAIALIRRRFASAHQARNGREPEFTCPTPLVSGGWFRKGVTRAVLRGLSSVPGDLWRGCLDYLFVSPGIRVVECGLILDRPAPGDPTLYASDHFGLAATLELPPRDPVRPGF